MKQTNDPGVFSGESLERLRRAHYAIWRSKSRGERTLTTYEPRSTAEAAKILQEAIEAEQVQPSELPHGKPRTALLRLIEQRRAVDLYRRRHDGELVLWIRPRLPWYEGRWSPAAWSMYVAGEHSPDPKGPCMCEPCQDTRQQDATARWRAVQTALLQAARATDGEEGGEPA
jgi:hypothetical protein